MLTAGAVDATRALSWATETTGPVEEVRGFLPPPGREGFVQDDAGRTRLEERLRTVLDRAR